MEGQYFIIICDDKADAIDKAIEALSNYRNGGGAGAFNESRGGANYRHDTEWDSMTPREREIYMKAKRESMTPAERRMYEMGLRDAYGRNGAENRNQL